MNQTDVENSLRLLEQLMNKGVLQEKEIFVFGMGVPGDRVICCLQKNGYMVSGVLDNNTKNYGKTFLGIPVSSPDILKTRNNSNIIVLTYSKWHNEMEQQLIKIGLLKEQVVCLLQEKQLPETDGSFEKALEDLDYSWEIYQHYRNQYGEDTCFVLVPISLGDVYICGTQIETLKQFHSRVLFMVHGEAGKKVAQIFLKKDVQILSKEHMDALVRIARVFGRDLTNIYAVPVSFHYSIIDNLLGYNGFHCMDLFRFAMNLPFNAPIAVPQTFDENLELHLTKRDILLIPYANSLPCFSPSFWEEIAKRLYSKGYRVYTNSSNDITEPVIAGTEKIFLPLDNMMNEVSGCGGVIALRCGLCDIISAAQCKKIILYPNKGRRYGTLKNYFSLNEMGLCKDAEEIIFDEDRELEIVEEIMGHFDLYKEDTDATDL